ncbi:hypothetical protein GJAV_G00265090 [Gymnothorax javanicus]|nr:hypothetical protein GJAV_G00265090 [Gymnothorax javanicus]
MDDSDLDFADLCSKLLKRVRKKERGDSGDEQRREASQNVTQNGAPEPSRSIKQKQDTESSSRGQLYCGPVSMTQLDRPAREESASQALAVPMTAPSAPSILVPAIFRTTGLSPGVPQNGDVNMRAKDKVVSRMQQFRWASPKKMMRVQDDLDAREGLDIQITNSQSAAPQVDSAQGPQGEEALALEDEALALRLQKELDQETRGPETLVDLELGGLFFCQICQKDLSAMSPLRRTQHINRCLDESEGSGPPAMAPPPVPECPICGKAFKSQKSRASHLKRCSAEMGVSPALLLQALQRQAAEVARDVPANQPPPATSTKRKAPSSDPTRPPKKRQKKKALPLDEDTMVALALSRSMVEEERERAKEWEREMEREREVLGTAVPEAADAKLPGLQWRAEAGKRRGKKKDWPPAPPPLLLVQDPETALRRLQNRVSALLLRSRPPCPPTPPRPASCLPGWSGAAPLWQKSALHDGGGCSVEQFYTPALCPPVQPWDAAIVKEVQTPTPPTHTEMMPPAHQPPCPAPSTPGLGSQVLGDLIELAEEGMTLTQWGYAPNVDAASDSTPDPEPMRSRDCDEAELRLSGFIPERLHRAGATNSTGALSKLAADLSSMVNNPQLSDVQLQVDSGEVFFAHSFMLYARCPLLVQMVHDSGFGVEEEGMPSARRVLLGDVPGEAVHALLQYLYCAQCPFTPMLLPHLQGLAHRWDLGELSRLCQGYTGGSVLPPEQQCREEEEDEEECGEQRFLELLRSMWEGEEEQQGEGEGEREGEETQDGGAEGRVDEEELLEIYEFAATQRRTRREGEGDWIRGAGHEGASQPSPGRRSCGSLNRSYERLFSETWGEHAETSQQEMQSSRSQALIDLSTSARLVMGCASIRRRVQRPRPLVHSSAYPSQTAGPPLSLNSPQKRSEQGGAILSPCRQQHPSRPGPPEAALECHLQSSSGSVAGSTPLRLRLSDSPSWSRRKKGWRRSRGGVVSTADGRPANGLRRFVGPGGGGGGRDPCFSLRLDSSAGASQAEQGSGEAIPLAPPPQQPLDPTSSYTSLLDSKVWDDWGEEPEEGAGLPLSQRVQNMAATQGVEQLKTPVTSRPVKAPRPLVPITPHAWLLRHGHT